MGKNIIFCADGTWNGPGESDAVRKATSNVFKLFAHLDGHDSADSLLLSGEQERVLRDAAGAEVQRAKYLHGVGDSGNFLVRLLGGSIGAGLITRIVRGYTFISRNYEPGDDLFIVGFSRGAYTARALGGLIAARGLLDADQHDLDDKERAYRLGTAAWYAYRRAALDGKPDWRDRLQEFAFDLPGFVTGLGARISYVDDVRIKAIAVWDTVGALGIPAYLLGKDKEIDGFQFADRQLSAKVAHGFHAVAIDERRADFVPTLWDADPRIVQGLFPGAHADVGGGYPAENGESDLSNRTLAWMMKKLQPLGVKFASDPLPASPETDAHGCAHRPWTKVPWAALPNGPRDFAAGLALSNALKQRLAAADVLAEPGMPALAYAPANLHHYLDGRTIRDGVVFLDD